MSAHPLPKRKLPTMRDVAQLAKVSPMTVSNVIRGDDRFYNHDTKKKVERAILKLNYRVASSGRSLRSGKRNSVGVIIVDESEAFMAHPFISRFVSGLCAELNRRSYTMIVQGLHPSRFRESFLISRAESDAYCIRLHGDDEMRNKMIEDMHRIPEPLVLFEEILPLEREDTCVVRQDDFGGGALMADHLIARGVRRIEVIVPKYRGPISGARINGLHEASRLASADMQISTIEANSGSFTDGYTAVAERLDRGPMPEMLLGMNDDLAFAAMRVLRDRGISIPEQVRVAGFNGFEPPNFTNPSLTTVVSQAERLGVVAGESLIERLETGTFSKTEVSLPVTFRGGDST